MVYNSSFFFSLVSVYPRPPCYISLLQLRSEEYLRSVLSAVYPISSIKESSKRLFFFFLLASPSLTVMQRKSRAGSSWLLNLSMEKTLKTIGEKKRKASAWFFFFHACFSVVSSPYHYGEKKKRILLLRFQKKRGRKTICIYIGLSRFLCLYNRYLLFSYSSFSPSEL